MHIQKTSSDFKIVESYKDLQGEDCDKTIELGVDYVSNLFHLSHSGQSRFEFDNCDNIPKMKAFAKCITKAIDIAEKELNQK